MSHAGYQYVVCHPLLGHQIARLTMASAEWTEDVSGPGSFAGRIVVPQNPDAIEILKLATEPDEAAIYVRDGSGNYTWGGPIISQEWDSKSRTILIEAAEWKSWLYHRFLAPPLNLTGDRLYNWDLAGNWDQLAIAWSIVGYAIEGGTADGQPPMDRDLNGSGVQRELHIKGLDFKYAGEVLDTMANRNNGFEWSIDSLPNDLDGLPRLRFRTYYPQRGSVVNGLVFKRTPGGSNFELTENIKRTSSSRRTRVWTTGESETMPYAMDDDPDLTTGNVLLREKVTNYSTVKERTTLSEHAIAERQYFTPKVNTVSLRTRMDGDRVPMDVGMYRAGDRGRLILRDDWHDFDEPAVRILSRKLMPFVSGGTVECVLDLADNEVPDVDV